MPIQRLLLFGAPGSGKTYLAEHFAAKTGVVHLELDRIIWEYSTGGKILQKHPEQHREKALHEMLSQNYWIIEGPFFQNWITPCLEQADLIILLIIPKYIRYYRVIKRAIQQRHYPSQLFRHLMFTHIWETDRKAKILKKLEPYNHKVQIINSSSVKNLEKLQLEFSTDQIEK